MAKNSKLKCFQIKHRTYYSFDNMIDVNDFNPKKHKSR